MAYAPKTSEPPPGSTLGKQELLWITRTNTSIYLLGCMQNMRLCGRHHVDNRYNQCYSLHKCFKISGSNKRGEISALTVHILSPKLRYSTTFHYLPIRIHYCTMTLICHILIHRIHWYLALFVSFVDLRIPLRGTIPHLIPFLSKWAYIESSYSL